MDWQKGTPPQISDRLIIIAAQDETKTYGYNVVSWYEPLEVWYGGPGIRVRSEDIEYWSEIQAPA
jgi:hypothetical protein